MAHSTALDPESIPPHRWLSASRPAGHETPTVCGTGRATTGRASTRELTRRRMAGRARPELRRRGHRERVRGQHQRPAAHREGLPRRGAGGGTPLRRDHAAEDVVAAAVVLLGSEARLLRHPAAVTAQGRDDPLGRRRRRRVARSTPTRCTSRSRPSTPTRNGATSPTGATSWRRSTTRPSECSASCRNPHDHSGRRGDAGGGRRDGCRRHVPPDPGGRVLRSSRASRWTIRSSAARGRRGGDASSAASA